MTDTASLERILEPSPASASLGFGGSLACSEDASVIVVGVPGEDKAFVFVDGEQITLTASDSVAGDLFGVSVACSSDGSVIVVGAPFDNQGANTDNGAVYVYSGANYGTETKLLASDLGSSQFLGSVVDCSSSGAVVVAAAPGNGSTGRAYVWSGSSYATERKLTPAAGTSSTRFGHHVAISGDGTVVVVGAPGQDPADKAEAGAAYVFSGSNYGTETMLTASDSAAGKLFGQSVACSTDGSTIVVGQSADYTAGVSEPGAAYICTGTGYSSQTKVSASDGGASMTFFGHEVACSSDGSVVLVGAELAGHGVLTRPGAAYVYSGSGYGTELKFVAVDPISDGLFGRSLAITEAGDLVLVGSNATVDGYANAGAVYSDGDLGDGAGWGLIL